MPKPRKPAPVPSYIIRTDPAAPTAPQATPPLPGPADMLSHVSRLLCPACRQPLATYGTAHRGAVTVRYHRCRHCGATRIRTHETDGKIAFVGWARLDFPRFSRN